MIFIKINTEFEDSFIVIDEDGSPVTGLTDGDFSKELYDPDKNEIANISAGIPVTIEELGNGLYRADFTPNKLGNWLLIVYHTTYFPWGKGDNYICVESLSDDLLRLIERILGLSQENYRLFNPQYDRHNNLIAGIIKIYSNADDVDTDNNPLAEYKISATFNLRTNLMTSYKVKKKP